jgi:GTP cyclohydrolase I
MDCWRQAVHYRNRATLLRLIAEEPPRDDHKESLRRVAQYFEEMAVSLEREAKAPPS